MYTYTYIYVYTFFFAETWYQLLLDKRLEFSVDEMPIFCIVCLCFFGLVWCSGCMHWIFSIVCMFIPVCLCICLYVFVCAGMGIYMYIYMYVCVIYAYVCGSICLCLCLCLCLCICVRVRVCVCVYMYIDICIICICSHTHNTHTHILSLPHPCLSFPFSLPLTYFISHTPSPKGSHISVEKYQSSWEHQKCLHKRE